MKTNKLPMAIFKRERELKLGKRFTVILSLLLLGYCFFLSYLVNVNSKKVESIKQKEYFDTGNPRVQLEGNSLVIGNFSSLQEQEEIKQQETKEQEIQKPILPVEGEIVHGFGWRKEKVRDTEEWRYLPGVDWKVEGIQEVKSVLAGTVESVEKRTDLGYTIVINHQHNLKSLYGYCTKVRVKPGELIAQGQLVAQIQDRLHFRILRNNQPFDPKEYFIN